MDDVLMKVHPVSKCLGLMWLSTKNMLAFQTFLFSLEAFWRATIFFMDFFGATLEWRSTQSEHNLILRLL